jgi:hypothetical protein
VDPERCPAISRDRSGLPVRCDQLPGHGGVHSASAPIEGSPNLIAMSWADMAPPEGPSWSDRN